MANKVTVSTKKKEENKKDYIQNKNYKSILFKQPKEEKKKDDEIIK